MKKILIILLTLLLILAMPAAALATTEEASAPVLEDAFFTTWAQLATYAGALMLTLIITQVLKEVPFIRRIPTRIFSYIIALIILIAATIFTAGFNWSTIILCAFNAFIVALAANGGYDALTIPK
ncbi:MAG: hypothetical protein PHT58_07170 [Eubacteriales bacterium]|nr:hypothetical protein [Eubacteriales bacterium]